MSLGIIHLKKVFMKKEKKKQLIFWQFFPFPIKIVSKLFKNGWLTITLRTPPLAWVNVYVSFEACMVQSFSILGK